MLTEQQRAFLRVLDLVDEAGCADHVILIGSWAEFVYMEAGALPGFSPNIRTLDVDFLIRNLRKPNPAARLAAVATDMGFYVDSDRLTGTTRLTDTTGLEVEFLIGKRGAGTEPALKTNVGVTAQALWHMDILSRNTVETGCLGHTVTVPSPEAYVVHKMVINAERGRKAEKDAMAIEGLLPLVNRRELETVFNTLSKKEKAKVHEFVDSRRISPF